MSQKTFEVLARAIEAHFQDEHEDEEDPPAPLLGDWVIVIHMPAQSGDNYYSMEHSRYPNPSPTHIIHGLVSMVDSIDKDE